MVSDGAESDTITIIITRGVTGSGLTAEIPDQASINNKSPDQIINSSMKIVLRAVLKS